VKKRRMRKRKRKKRKKKKRRKKEKRRKKKRRIRIQRRRRQGLCLPRRRVIFFIYFYNQPQVASLKGQNDNYYKNSGCDSKILTPFSLLFHLRSKRNDYMQLVESSMTLNLVLLNNQ